MPKGWLVRSSGFSRLYAVRRSLFCLSSQEVALAATVVLAVELDIFRMTSRKSSKCLNPKDSFTRAR